MLRDIQYDITKIINTEMYHKSHSNDCKYRRIASKIILRTLNILANAPWYYGELAVMVSVLPMFTKQTAKILGSAENI